MKICGLMKTTLLDYPGKVAATVFVGGCNFRCPFCHNGDLVLHSTEIAAYSEEEVLEFLKKRKNVLEGVCITGGEPTLYSDLPDFLGKIKDMGYLIKLDTNGSQPEMVRRLLDSHLTDYVAMDIKAPLSHYDRVCGIAADKNAIEQTVQLLLSGETEYEFRTTVVRELHSREDILAIGRWISGAKAYYLQNYRDSDKNICRDFSAVDRQTLTELREILKKDIQTVEIRGVE